MRKKSMAIFLCLICLCAVCFGSAPVVFGASHNSNAASLDLRSEFRTPINNKSEDRVHNIKLALSKINGQIMKSEESFSFNEFTGRRTKENGYRESIIIFNGEYTKGYGGGVCQASTTLYNALVLSDVFINEVHSHTIKPGYVEMSFDAMVNAVSHDLRWTNTTGADLLIKAYIEDGEVVVKIFGEKPDYEIRRVSKIIKVILPGEKIIVDTEKKYSEWKGGEEEIILKKPAPGYKTSGQLQYFRNGKLFMIKKIRTDWYCPTDGLIVRNPNNKILKDK